MKKITKIIGIALIFGLILVGFAGAVSATDGDTSGSGDTEETSTTPIEITAITISNIKPEVGNSLATTVSASCTTLSLGPTLNTTELTWKVESNTATTAEVGKQYTASFIVSIPSNEMYVFPNDTTKFTATIPGITSNQNISISNLSEDKKSLKITCTYPITTLETITSVELSGITKPVAGYKGVITGVSISKVNGEESLKNKVTVSEVKWNKGSSETTEAFQPGDTNKYKVIVKLTAGTGYEFSDPTKTTVTIKTGSNSDSTVTGNVSSNSTKEVLVIESKETTASAEIDKITISDLDIPTIGLTPDSSYTIKGNDYISSITSSSTGNSITWYKLDSSTTGNTISSSDTAMTSTDVFASGNKYGVKIVLNAPNEYKFASSPSITINGKAATPLLSNDNKTVTIICNYGNPEKGKITIVNVTDVAVPVVGNSASSSSNATAKGKISSNSSDISLTASVSWELDGTAFTGSFEANKKYTAVITVTTPSDYGYNTSSVTATVTDSNKELTQYPNNKITTKTDTQIVIKHTFKETDGSIKSVQVTFTEPALDKSIPTTATVSSQNPSNSISSATISWNPSGSKFEGGNTYKATVTIKAKTGYTFTNSTSVSLNSISCKSSEITLSSDKTTLTATHTYNKLATPITSVTIEMDKPVTGKEASSKAKVTSVPSSDLDAIVSWSPSISELGVFEEETVYTATITVKNNNSDYAFNSSTTAKIIVGNGETVAATISSTPTATSMTVKCTFEETNKKGLFNLDIGDEEATIPYPKDFFTEIIAFFKAIFDFSNWKILN